MTEIRPVVMWKTGEVFAAPIAVDSVRITITSPGLSEPLIKTFPFSRNEGTLGFVRSGLTITIMLEGLTSDGRVLYSGEQICDAISGKSFTVQIEASEVTPVPPENPQSLSSTFSLMISWSDVSNNEAGYIIYRSVHGKSSFEEIDTVSGLSYVDTSISDSLFYDYRIFSFNEVGISVIFTDIENLSLKVNHKPEFSTVPLDSQKVKLGNLYRAPVKATDPDSGDSVRLSFSNKLELIKDTLRWNFSKSDTGINKFFITVFDRYGDSARYNWNVLVMDTAGPEKNTPPQFTTQISGPDTVEIENSYSRTLAATDADGDSITFSKENAPQDMKLNTSSGRVTWLPDTLGLFTVVIIAEDDSGAQDRIEWQIQVRDHFNLLTKISDLKDSAKVGTEYMDTILCNLPGAKFYLKEGPDNLHLDSLSGAVSWTPDATGGSTVKVSAVYKSDTLSISWTITVKATNSAPRFITEPEDLIDTIAAGIVYKDTLLVEDDDNSREFTRIKGPGLMEIDSNGVITWDVPDSLWDTTVQVKIKVSDPEGEIDTLTWGIFIKKPNAPPTINTQLKDLKDSITAGKVYKDTIDASDKESEEILYKVVSGPLLFKINSSGAIIWAVPDALPDTTVQVKIKVYDPDSASDSISWSIDVSEKKVPPKFMTDTLDITRNAEAGSSYSVTLEAQDRGDSLIFKKISGPVIINKTSDTICMVNWEVPGVYSDTLIEVSIRVLDPDSLSDTISWKITVDGNAAPVINTKPTSLKNSVTYGNLYEDSLSVTDKDGDSLTFSCISGQSITFESTGKFKWEPDSSSKGHTVEVAIKVSDPAGASDTVKWSIDVLTANIAPEISSQATDMKKAVVAGELYKDTVEASDQNEDELTFTVKAGPSGLTIGSSTGIITWTPDTSLHGETVAVTIKVSDPAGAFDTVKWSIDVLTANIAPEISSQIGDMKETVVAGELYKDTVEASDQDEDALTFSVNAGPSGLTIDPSSGIITWTPDTSLQGDNVTVTIKVSDPAGAFDTVKWSIDVLTANIAPEISSQAADMKNTVVAGELYKDTVEASDQNEDALTFSVQAGPSGLTIGSSTGIITWTPDTSLKGENVAVTIKVSDPASAFDTVKWSIDILVPNIAPEISSQIGDMKETVVAGELYKDTVEASDQDEDALTFSVKTGPSGLIIDPSSGVIIWTPDTSLKGQNVAVTIKVSDPAGAFDTIQWFIDVLIPNIAPEISSQIGDMKKTAIAEEQYVDTVEASDQNGSELTFTVKTGPSGLTIDPSSGIITWTPETALQGDNFTVTIKVSDPQGAYDTLSWEIAVNTPPNFTTMMENLETSAVWGVIYEELLEAEDNDAGDELTYFVVDGPASVNPTSGLVTWTPGPSDESVSDSTHIKIRVTDKAGQYDEISWAIWVYANGAPNLVYKTIYDTAYYNTSHTDTVKFYNYENDSLTWEYTPSEGITIVNQNGPIFTWKALADGTIRIIVSDPWNSDTSELKISVIVSHSVNITGFLEFDSRGVPGENFTVTIPTVVCESDIETHPVKYKFFLPNGSQTNWSSINTITQVQNSFGIYQYKVAARCTVDTTETDTSGVGYVPILNVNCDTANLVLIDNCDLETNKNILGFDWRAASDEPVGGNSTLSIFDMDPVTYYYDYHHTSSSGFSSTGGASISYTLGNDVLDLNGNALEPHVFLETRLAPDGSYKNLSAATKIRFRAKCNSGTVNVRFQVLTPQVANGDFYGKDITLTTSWQSFEIKNYVYPSDPSTGAPGELRQKGYGGIVAYYRNQAQAFRWKISGNGTPASNGITVDDLTLEDWNYIP